MTQQAAAEYLTHGQINFFRLPSETNGSNEPKAPHAVLIGVPYDGGTTYQPGARLAPYHVRRVSALVQSFHPSHEFDIFERLQAFDGGNVPAAPFSSAMMREQVRARTSEIVAQNGVPFVVGGDHSIALPIMRALASHHGPIAMIHVDAHLDTSSADLWREEFHHGTFLRHALAEGLVRPEKLFQVGIRATRGHRDETKLVRDFGARLYSADQFSKRSALAIANEIRETVGDAPAYLSFDIDAIDPAFAPGTGTPVPGGMSSREAIEFMRGLIEVRLVGMDLVEVCPPLDHADITSHLAAQLLYEGLAIMAARA